MGVKPEYQPDAVDDEAESAPPALMEAIRRGLDDAAAGRVVDGTAVVARLRRQASALRADLSADGHARRRG